MLIFWDVEQVYLYMIIEIFECYFLHYILLCEMLFNLQWLFAQNFELIFLNTYELIVKPHPTHYNKTKTHPSYLSFRFL